MKYQDRLPPMQGLREERQQFELTEHLPQRPVNVDIPADDRLRYLTGFFAKTIPTPTDKDDWCYYWGTPRKTPEGEDIFCDPVPAANDNGWYWVQQVRIDKKTTDGSELFPSDPLVPSLMDDGLVVPAVNVLEMNTPSRGVPDQTVVWVWQWRFYNEEPFWFFVAGGAASRKFRGQLGVATAGTNDNNWVYPFNEVTIQWNAGVPEAVDAGGRTGNCYNLLEMNNPQCGVRASGISNQSPNYPDGYRLLPIAENAIVELTVIDIPVVQDPETTQPFYYFSAINSDFGSCEGSRLCQ